MKQILIIITLSLLSFFSNAQGRSILKDRIEIIPSGGGKLVALIENTKIVWLHLETINQEFLRIAKHFILILTKNI